MLTRLTHAALAFALMVVVYQAYVLLAVPVLEPGAAVRAEQDVAERPLRVEPMRHKYRKLLAAYFPPDHWTLAKPPKTFESRQAMVFLDGYRTSDDGQLRVNKCAFIFFPRARDEAAPRDAIVLEAPHGAVIQMDEALGAGLGAWGRIQWGKLLGEITVRSAMQAAGPEDDLLLTTRDLYMNEDHIRTDALVDMRLGPHAARGRVLEIQFKPFESSKAGDQGFEFAGVESLEIQQAVAAELDATRWVSGTTAGGPGGPVQITSQGPFRYHFPHQRATFEKQVLVEQVSAAGERDQLRCEKLSLYVAGGPGSAGKLRPGSLLASGSAERPLVTLDAPSRGASAVCQRMYVEIDSRRITWDGNDEVALTYQGSEIHAPLVSYQAPARDAPQRIGNFLAAGHGWIRLLPAAAQSARPVEVRWTEELRLTREQGRPVLRLRGRPRLEMVGLGRLWADDLKVVLRESAHDGSEADLLPGEIVPARVTARGQVAMDSAQLRGHVRELEVGVDYVATDASLAGPPGNDLERPSLGGAAGNQRSYRIDGQRLKMQLTVRDRTPEVTSIDVMGDVNFREATRAATKQALEVRADSLRVEQADSPNAEITLRGQPAQVTAAGTALRAEELLLHRGTSQAWIQSPGELELPVDRDFSGQRLSTPQQLLIRWQRGMELDQDRVVFQGDVHVESGEGALQTDQLTARLTAPILFDGAARQARVELAELACSGGARGQFSQRDATGLTSVQTMTIDDSLRVNQQTGQISGRGGGWLESVHLSGGGAGLLGDAGTRAGQRLHFLRVDFVRGMRGDLNHRQVEVLGDVEAVYGPVDSWEQKLAKTVRGLPGPGTTWVSAGRLGVAVSPLSAGRGAGMGPLEVTAYEDVTIEGRVGERGIFSTYSQAATYDQSKTMFILEGNQQQPATLTHQQYVGAPPSETAARKIRYVHATGEVQVEGILRGGWKQIDLGQDPSRPPVR